MNILILINGAPKYKYFYYNLSKSLSDQGDVVYFAVDAKSSKYLEPVPEIDEGENTFYFSKYFEDNFNKKIDSLYPCTYGEFFYSDFDRFLTHNYNLNKSANYWKQARLCLDKFFHDILTDNKIDFILYENISNSFAYSAWRVGELLNVKYLGLMGARIPGRFEIQYSIIDNEVERITKLTNLSISDEEKEWFTKYREGISYIQPDYMKNNGLNNVSLSKLFKLERVRSFYRIIKASVNINTRYEYQRGNVWERITRNTIINLHRFIVSKLTSNFFWNESILKEKDSFFYVYPIHYHPESSTSVLAPEYTNEYTNIVNISNNLPFGHYLYVKDHVSAKGIQSYSFYKKISALPNVKLIDSAVNIKTLIKESCGVITINSTAGYEALLLEKPVYILGRVFYECFPYVYRIHSFKDIPSVINSSEKIDLDELARWYVAYYNYTNPGRVLINSDSNLDGGYFDDMVRIIKLHA